MRLLVSVRNVDEARLAVSGGADIVDIKEPQNGSLGQAPKEVITSIADVIDQQHPLSAAMGELKEFDASVQNQLPDKICFAKFGLSGMRSLCHWPELWQKAYSKLHDSIQQVAVVYADSMSADSPAPLDIASVAATTSKCKIVLIDTFRKDKGNLLQHMSLSQLRDFCRKVQDSKKAVALAGSLDQKSLPVILSDPVLCETVGIIAVRGAACVSGRSSTISLTRVQALSTLLKPTSAESHLRESSNYFEK